MRIAYDNFIDDLESTSISASSEDISYPLTNAQDQRLTVKWKTELSDATAIFDLGATAACSIFAVMSHNLLSAGTVTVNGNDNILPGLTWTASDESSTQTITYNSGIMLAFITPLSNRYWKFTFAGQPVGFEVGRLWIGDYITVDPSSTNDFQVIKKRDDTVVYGKNRQKYASIGNGWRRFEFTFPRTAGTTLTAIQTLYDTVGNHSSFIFCNFNSLRGYPLVEPCYVSIDGEMGFSHTTRQYYTYSLAMEEDR